MSIVFNADEVFEIAAQIERNGGEFYRRAAENNSEGRDFLLEIAEQEDRHLATFEAMRKKLTAREKETTAFDPDGAGALYLKAMAGGHVFDVKKNPSETLKGNESLEEIINIAIGMEKDSILFYVGLKEMVPEILGKGKMDHIIKEEMKHICWLSDKLS